MDREGRAAGAPRALERSPAWPGPVSRAPLQTPLGPAVAKNHERHGSTHPHPAEG